MSDATAAPLFEGQGISVELRDVEAELARLWGPAALELAGPELETPHVTRVVLANLVVECLGGNVESVAPVLETVMARFPCRAILLCGTGDLDRRLTAEISALCHLPSPGLPQVCSERIVLGAGKNAADLVPGAVRSLLEANLPHLLWWTGDPRMHEPLFRELASMCSRLVLDLPDPGGKAGAIKLGLDPAVGTCSRDSAWFGLARWRELIAQLFDAPGELEKLRRIDSVTVEAILSDPAYPPRASVWLLAWLAGQLDWKPASCEWKLSPDDSSSALEARFLGPLGDVTGTIVTRSIPGCTEARSQLAGVTLKTPERSGDKSSVETFRLVRPWPGSPAVLVETETNGSARLPRGIEAPELDPARRIATALESSRADIPFRNARPIALWLMEYAKS